VQKVLFSKTIVRKLQEFFQEAIVDYWWIDFCLCCQR
jgi:hypothetical protein